MSRTVEQAYYDFISGFGWAAYDENTVPEDAELPRITYNFAYAEFETPVSMSISVWDRSTAWTSVTEKAWQINRAIGLGGKILPYDDGYIWVKRDTPFSQRMSDPDDTIRRIYINVEVEYLTSI